MTDDTLLYFAYGSNMSTQRLQARMPSARPIGKALLTRHRLKFHKTGQDGSGKCDIEATNQPDDVIHGVIYEISVHELPALDRAEGLGYGYEKKDIEITDERGGLVKAFTYYATSIDESLIPFDWYKNHVLVGAQEHGLPQDYISEYIEDLAVKEDQDTERTQKEYSIYKP